MSDLPDRLAHPLASRKPAGALRGSVRVPGDKGISHRALVLGGLALGETRISGLLDGEDVLRTAAALRALGAEVVQDAPGAWRVAGRGIGALVEPADVLDVGGSGASARLLAGLLASHPLFAVLTGDASLRRQSMSRVTAPLAACGARFSGPAGGRLPLAVEGASDALPIACRLPVASAQVKSALLFAGLNAPGETRVEEPEPTRDHTERMLRHFGAEVRVEQARWSGRIVTLVGQPELRAADVLVPGDPSSAAFPLAAALLTPGSAVTVEGVGLNPLRTGLFDTLREMGADLAVLNERSEGGETVGDVTATYGALRGVEVPPRRALGMVDDHPVLAVVAACAAGATRMRGLRGLRAEAGDRLAVTAALLAANGVRIEITGDDLVVHGGRPRGGAVVVTAGDHNVAMSALVLGCATAEPVGVDDGEVIEAGFPGFAGLMRGLGADIA